MASQWQKVGKDGRGVRKESAKKKRKQDHSFNPVVVEPAEPIRESETKFSAINKRQNLDDSGSSEGESLPPPLSKLRAKPAVKKVDKQEKKEEWKLDDLSPIDVLQQLEAAEIKDCFELAKSRYGNVQSSWLRDLGQHFKQKFADGLREPLDATTEMWSNNLTKDVSLMLRRCYHECPPESLDAFYATCVDNLSNEIHLNGHPAAYQLLIHTLQVYRPKVISSCVKQLEYTLQTCISRPHEVLTLLKSILPCPKCSNVQMLAEGFDVYCQVVAPYYISPSNVPKSVLKYSMTYLHQLCQFLLEVARKQPLDEVAHFKDLVKFVTAPVPKQLVSEYRSIVRHALESVMTVCITLTHPIPRSSIFHEGYVHLADHFGDEEEKHLKRLVSRLVVVCDACREEWMELHEDFLKQSLILLNELLRKSPKVKPLGPLLQRMKDDLPRLKEKETDISLCRRYVNELLDKCEAEGDSDEEMEEGGGGVEAGPRFLWMSFLRKLLIVLFFLVIVDIGWNQGWAGSLTCTGLAAVGVRIPVVTMDPLFSYITRTLEDFSVSKNLLNIWLDTIYFLQTVWGLVLDYFFLAGRMYKDLFYIAKHCLWDHLKQLSLQDYINHVIKPN